MKKPKIKLTTKESRRFAQVIGYDLIPGDYRNWGVIDNEGNCWLNDSYETANKAARAIAEHLLKGKADYNPIYIEDNFAILEAMRQILIKNKKQHVNEYEYPGATINNRRIFHEYYAVRREAWQNALK